MKNVTGKLRDMKARRTELNRYLIRVSAVGKGENKESNIERNIRIFSQIKKKNEFSN